MKYTLYTLFLLLFISCSNDDNKEIQTLNVYNVWSGPKIEFIKEAGSDSTNELHQDKITSSVSITRGNSGGQIYNILLEEKSSKGVSPLGTKWAIGEISNISALSFSSFRSAVGTPKDVVGKNLVLHIEKEDIYLSVVFKNWGTNQNGSFSYERSTKN